MNQMVMMQAGGSAPAECSSSDYGALRELPGALSRSGFGEFCASFNPLAPRPFYWASRRSDAPPRIRALVDLFVLGQPVEGGNVDEALNLLIEPLLKLKLLVTLSDGRLATPGLSLLPVFGHWLFFQRPALRPSLYFGDDSLALFSRLRPPRNGVCLDLCAGPGIQSLQCSAFARKVIAVEVNPVAAALAEVNSVLNGREDIIEVRCGSLYEPVPEREFDAIIANPPLVPFPEELPYPFVGHGGTDGMQVMWRILDGVPAALAPGGTAQFIGTCLSDGISPLITRDLRRWAERADCSVILTVTSHQPLSLGTEYFDGLIFTACAGRELEPGKVANAVREWLAEQGASHLAFYYLLVTLGGGHLEVLDLSRNDTNGGWYI